MYLNISLYKGGDTLLSKIKAKAELLADRLDLPTDAALGMTKLTVFGRRKLLVENHKGISSYETEHIMLDCVNTKLSVRGNNLMLTAMDENDMIISGSLLSIEFE